MKEERSDYRDGGYGWVVVLVAFLSLAIVDGISYSYGLLLVDLVDAFQSSRGQAALAGGLGMGFTCIGCLIAGPLSDLYGYRVVVVAGALISTAGFVASTFVTELYHLYFTYGLVGGIGFGLVYTPPLVCVIHNFDKKRSLANGVAMCGTGAGMFGLNALVRYLLDVYGWRGTFMIMGGISLHAAVCGLLLNSPSQADNKTEERRTKSNDEAEISESVHIEVNNHLKAQTTNVNNENDIATVSLFQIKERVGERGQNTDIGSIDIAIISNTLRSEDSSGQYLDRRHKSQFITETKDTNVDNVRLKDSHQPSPSFRRIFTETRDMLNDMKLLTFLIAALAISFGFLVPLHLLPDQAADNDIPKSKAFWITACVGIGNTSGRLMFGFLGDRQCMNRLLLFVTAITLCGVATILSCLNTDFVFKLAYGCTFGIFLGGYVCLAPVVLADIVGANRIGKGFGLFMGINVFGFSFGGPLGGWIFDTTINYDITFSLAGAFIIAGAIIFTVPRLCNRLPCNRIAKHNNI